MFAMAGREVYCQLRMGKPDAARKQLTDFLHVSKVDDQALSLVAYAVKNGVDATSMTANLEKLYRQTDRQPHLAIAIARMMPAAEGRKLLAGHLAARPADRVVLERSVDDAVKDGSPKALAAMLHAAGAAITAQPSAARVYRQVVRNAEP